MAKDACLVSKGPLLILASHSPRRRELLAEAGYRFQVRPPQEDVECGVCSTSGPEELVAELAFRKAAAVVRELQREMASGSPDRSQSEPIVLAADTVVECNGMIFGKPRDEQDATKMLRQLSGRDHHVLTGICLWRLGDVKPLVRVAVTHLKMDSLNDEQILEYVSTGAWESKAGAFGYQDRLGWIHIVEGSESNVVGLPMEYLDEMLIELAERSDERESRDSIPQ